MTASLEAWVLAARKLLAMPDDWHGCTFSAGQPDKFGGAGIFIRGACCPPKIRGPNKGAPNFRKARTGTWRGVSVSVAQAAAAQRRIDRKAHRHAAGDGRCS